MKDKSEQEKESNHKCEVIKEKIDKWYYKYIYHYKTKTQNQEGLNELKKNKFCTCNSFCILFGSKFIHHFNLIFIFPWYRFTNNDADGCLVKLIVLILYIGLFMTFSMIVELIFHIFIYSIADGGLKIP